jgi:hypothetical protein
MKNKASPILVGIIAGLATAILFAVSTLMPLVFQLVAFTVLFFAGLGYGRLAALVAVATAAVALGGLVASPLGGLLLAVTLLPAAVMSHLGGLARPASEIGGPETALAWYPLSDILLAGAVMTALATIFLLFLQPLDTLYDMVITQALQLVSEADPTLVVQPDVKAQAVAMLKVFGPIYLGISSMVQLFAGFYFAMRILTALGRNIRPREDVRSSLRMNRLSIAVFSAGVLLMLGGEKAAVVGASFAGAMAGGFLLSGFAIIHEAVRGKPWGLPALVLLYLVTLIFPPVTVVIAVAGGLANPRRAIALTPTKPDQTSNPSN